MAKIKIFFVNHFEKLALAAAILIAIVFFIGVFQRGRVDELQEDIEDLIKTIEVNMQGAGVEPKYDPEQVPDYAEQALGPFKNVPKAVRLAGVRFYPVVIIQLDPIKLELPPGVPFEKTFEAYSVKEGTEPPEATVVRIDNEDLGTVELVDPQHFVLRRGADLIAEDDSTLIHIWYKDERHAVRPLEVTIRIVYIPQPPQDVAGYPRPGRNFIIWSTHEDDLENVVGFNIYRKELEEAEFDLENPLNRELIEPLDYVPEVGEDEEGNLPEGEGEPEAPGEEEGEPDEEPAEEKPFVIPGPDEEGVRERPRSIFDQKMGGKFVDRDVTPLQAYWYAVQTVAKKPEEERGREAPGEGEDLYSRSTLSKQVMIKGGDVIKIVFTSVMGNIDDPEMKKQARAGIEIRRFVKTDWVVGRFNVKIGGKVGGDAWVKDYPEIDPETDEIIYNGRMVDFSTKYTLGDIAATIKKEPYKVKKYRPDPKTGRMIEQEVVRYREIKTYKVVFRHEDGSSKEYTLEKPRRRRPRPETKEDEERLRTDGRQSDEERRMEKERQRRMEEQRRRLEAEQRLMEERNR